MRAHPAPSARYQFLYYSLLVLCSLETRRLYVFGSLSALVVLRVRIFLPQTSPRPRVFRPRRSICQPVARMPPSVHVCMRLAVVAALLFAAWLLHGCLRLLSHAVRCAHGCCMVACGGSRMSPNAHSPCFGFMLGPYGLPWADVGVISGPLWLPCRPAHIYIYARITLSGALTARTLAENTQPTSTNACPTKPHLLQHRIRPHGPSWAHPFWALLGASCW
jgi:hypothetical protein